MALETNTQTVSLKGSVWLFMHVLTKCILSFEKQKLSFFLNYVDIYLQHQKIQGRIKCFVLEISFSFQLISVSSTVR